MFQDSLVESGGQIQTRRGFTTAISFGVESLLLVALVFLPLFHTEALPLRLWSIERVLAPPPAASGRPASRLATRTAASNFLNGRLLPPPRIPLIIANIVEDQAPPVLWSNAVASGTGDGQANGIPGSIPTSGPAPVLPPPPPTARPFHVSQGVVQGLLVHQVKPEYPVLARNTRIAGTVVLRAIIGRDGTIGSLQIVSGHPWLAGAALEAVRQWRYRPHTLNGEPVEVDTFITVRFILSGKSHWTI